MSKANGRRLSRLGTHTRLLGLTCLVLVTHQPSPPLLPLAKQLGHLQPLPNDIPEPDQATAALCGLASAWLEGLQLTHLWVGVQRHPQTALGRLGQRECSAEQARE